MCVSFFCSVYHFLTANRWNIFFMSTAKLKIIQPLKLVIPFPLRSIPFQITKCLIRNPKKAFFSSLPPRCNTLSRHFLMIAGWIATCWNIFWRSLSKLLCKNSKTFVAWSLLCQHQNVITITSLRSQEKLLWEIMAKYAVQGLVHTHRVIFKNTFFGGLSSGLASVLTNRGTEFTQICQMQRAMHTHTHTPGKNSNYLWPWMSSSCFPAIVYSPINSLRCENGGGIERRLFIHLHVMAESKEKANKKLNCCQISPLWLTTQTFNLNSRSNVIDCLVTALQLVTSHLAHGQICHFVVLLLLKNAKPVFKITNFLMWLEDHECIYLL